MEREEACGGRRKYNLIFVFYLFLNSFQGDVEFSLQTIHNIATENLGSLCITKSYRPLQISLNTERYDGARQKVDLAALVLQDVGVNRHGKLNSIYSNALFLR